MNEANETNENRMSYNAIMKRWFPEAVEDLSHDREKIELVQPFMNQLANKFLDGLTGYEETKFRLDFSKDHIKKMEKAIVSKELRDDLMNNSKPGDRNSDFSFYVDSIAAYIGETIRTEVDKKGMDIFWKPASNFGQSWLEYKDKDGQLVKIKPFDMVIQRISDDEIDKEAVLSEKVKKAILYAES